MKNVGLLIFIIFLLLSCGKKKERVLHLKAINPATGQAIPDLKWLVWATRTGGNGEKKVFEETGLLNANGEAQLTVKLKDSWTYNISIQSPHNTCYVNNPEQHIKYPDEKEQNFLFEFAPCAYMKFRIANQNCEGPNDKLTYEDRFSYTDWIIGTNGIFGCFQNETNGYDAVPSGLRIYKWRVERSTGTTEYLDSIFLAAGDSGIFEMYY